VQRDAAARRAEKKLIFASRLKIGKKWIGGGGRLQQDAQGVKAMNGYMDVLLRRRA
jgi:hypothetical protein